MDQINEKTRDAFNAMVDEFGESRVKIDVEALNNGVETLQVIFLNAQPGDEGKVCDILNKYNPDMSVSGFENNKI